MTCLVCQGPVPEGARFCPYCGATLAQGEPEEVNPALLDLVRQYERQLRDNPHDTTTRFNLGLTYLQMKRWGAAAQQLDLVRQQEPDFPDAWYWAAVAYFKVGQKERARALLAEFLRRFPDHPKVKEWRRKSETLPLADTDVPKLLSPKGGASHEGIGENETSAGL
ncbi:MAG: hypothetical protein C4295_04090 [Candidatus Fervidibacterota bacterium]